jgi:hypothetical protein
MGANVFSRPRTQRDVLGMSAQVKGSLRQLDHLTEPTRGD